MNIILLCIYDYIYKNTLFYNMLMQNKKGLIMGVANDRSIAWGIAKKLSEIKLTFKKQIVY